jgi:hypothetical protein
MKQLIIIPLFFLFFISTTSIAQTYASDDGKFEITFQCEYQEKVSEGSRPSSKIRCEDEGQAFSATFIVADREIPNSKSIAKYTLSAIAKSSGGELKSESDWKVGKHTGVKGIIQVDDRDYKIDYRILYVGKIQYQIVYGAVTADFDEKKAATFFKSFKLTN